MNPAPGTSWPDLHYADTEQVELNVPAIIARGTRLRRRRLIVKVAATTVVIGIAPAAVVADLSTPVLNSVAVKSATSKSDNSTAQRAPRNGAMAGPAAPATTSTDHAAVRLATTLPDKYGKLLAVATARAGAGLWFTATAAQLTLFHLSTAGALKSWPLPTPAAAVRASAGVGLAVTSAGVAWIGVGSRLLRLDTRNSQVTTWRMPAAAAQAMADSVAVSPDGLVAVATSHQGSVQVLDPRAGTFRPVRLPDPVDQPLAVAYTPNGILGVGYLARGEPRAGAVLLVTRAGAARSTRVRQPTAVTADGGSGLLVGVTTLTVVPARGQPRPLSLPAGMPGFASVTTPPVPLPGNRLGIALGTAILTFPAAAASNAVAFAQSDLWVTPSPRCQPRHRCPAGYRLLAGGFAGDLWAVPRADPRTVELISLR